MSALGVEALCRAKMCAKVADLGNANPMSLSFVFLLTTFLSAAAFSVEVLQGTYLPFTPQIHEVRPHKGQIATAKRVSRFLRGWKSEISEAHAGCGKVQDAYTLRCVPQVW